MSDENTYMSAVKDRVGDLAHRAYDAVSGVLSSPSAPAKPAATSQPATQHLGVIDSLRNQHGGGSTNQAENTALSDT